MNRPAPCGAMMISIMTTSFSLNEKPRQDLLQRGVLSLRRQMNASQGPK